MTNEDNVRRILFGNGVRNTSISALADQIGESYYTVRNWKKHPLKLDFGKMVRVAEAVGLSDDEIVQLFKGGEK